MAAVAAMGGGATLAGVMTAVLVAFGMALAPAVAAALTTRALLVWAPVAVGRITRSST